MSRNFYKSNEELASPQLGRRKPAPLPAGMDPADYLRQQLEAVGLDCTPYKKKKDGKKSATSSSSNRDGDKAKAKQSDSSPAPKKPLQLGYHPVLPKSQVIKKSWNYQRPPREKITANDLRRMVREREMATPRAPPVRTVPQPPALRRSDSQEFRDWQNEYRAVPDTAIIPQPWQVQYCADPRTVSFILSIIL